MMETTVLLSLSIALDQLILYHWSRSIPPPPPETSENLWFSVFRGVSKETSCMK